MYIQMGIGFIYVHSHDEWNQRRYKIFFEIIQEFYNWLINKVFENNYSKIILKK